MSANSHFCAVILLETLASGEDQGLEAAHVHFHKAVEQKRGVIFNTTLANVQNIHRQVTSLRDFVQVRPSRSGCALETQKSVFPYSAGEQRKLRQQDAKKRGLAGNIARRKSVGSIAIADRAALG